MNVDEEWGGCAPILLRTIFMPGWTDVFTMRWGGHIPNGMSRVVTREVREEIMSSSDLTVVVMTRDWVGFLTEALASVFDRKSNSHRSWCRIIRLVSIPS